VSLITKIRHTITFHGVGPPPRPLSADERHIWLDTEQLCTELDHLQDRDDVRITFDDGNASDVEIALPALRERGLTAVFFVIAGFIGEPGYLDDAGIRELAAEMTVGCHGMHHRDWRRLDDRGLDEELIKARQRLGDVAGREIHLASCPFGSYDRRVLSRLRATRAYEHVYTSDESVTRPDAWLQPRSTLTRGRRDCGVRLPTEVLRRRSVQRVKMAVKQWR
jgi:peptidoglycan/xylan/chitin deacetylase (PgdA/CDA1 family)